MNLLNEKDITRTHYKRFYNIFLYITERCQLRCRHCYMGDRLERGKIMDIEAAKRIIKFCYGIGARYLTFLGGEPTLHPELSTLISFAKEVGYKQLMVDSNGLLVGRLLKLPASDLHNITISLDGATAESHDYIRGKGTFEKTVNAIKLLLKNDYRVRINYTVSKSNIHEAETVLQLAESIGIHHVNFHTFSEEGYGIDNLQLSLNPDEWIDFYENLEKIKTKYQISIWYPPTWVKKDYISKYVNEGFQGCLGITLDRLSIFPDGRAYVCSVLFDTNYNFGYFKDGKLEINKDSSTNEFDLFMNSIKDISKNYLSGCPAEETLESNGKLKNKEGIISMCRCWKSQA